MNACEIFLEHRNKQKQEPITPHDIPNTPWTKVATVIFHLGRKPYLAIVDYTTNFFDISQLPHKLSSMVVIHVKHLLSKYEIPKVVISDNDPEFTANIFKTFSKLWDFKLTTSSPHYSKSNGQIKRTIERTLKGNNDPYLALLAARISPSPENKTPPATLFCNRKIRTLLPSMNEEVGQENTKLILSNSTQHRIILPPFKINDSVRLHDEKTWTITGKVIKKLENTSTYLLEINKGILRRNRQHILLDRRRNNSKSRTIDDYDS